MACIISSGTLECGSWVCDFLSTRFFQDLYKMHEFLTLHAKSMWWEIDSRLIFFLNFRYFSGFFFIGTVSQDL